MLEPVMHSMSRISSLPMALWMPSAIAAKNGFLRSGTMKPIDEIRPRLRLLAALFGSKPRSAMQRNTCRRVSRATWPRSLMTALTVPIDTPASRATSRIVGREPVLARLMIVMAIEPSGPMPNRHQPDRASNSATRSVPSTMISRESADIRRARRAGSSRRRAGPGRRSPKTCRRC